MKNIWYNNICSLDNIDEQNKMMRNGVIGSTADSDSVSRGSSPLSVVPWQGRRMSFVRCPVLLSECGSAW